MIELLTHNVIKIEQKHIHKLKKCGTYVSEFLITYLDYSNNEQEVKISLFADLKNALKVIPLKERE